MERIKKTRLSISAVVKANEIGKDFSDAHLFVSTIKSQVKHPIILRYKAQLTSIRQQLGYTDHKFRKLLNIALNNGLATIEGKHLRLHSNNQDRKLKNNKRNDYRITSDPIKFRELVLFKHHYYRQLSLIKQKERQTNKGINTSVSTNAINDKPNHYITASARSIAKLFHYKSQSTANIAIGRLAQENLIKLELNKREITKQECQALLAKGKYNVMRENGIYYKYQRTYTLNYTLRRTEYEPFYALTEKEQVTYLELGYSIRDVNRILSIG